MNPEILFMDEPFSQVDALTAEGLRAEVLDIWDEPNTNPSSILMVSHDIKEVAYMANRIVGALSQSRPHPNHRGESPAAPQGYAFARVPAAGGPAP